jgi:hypothetical protein
VNEVHIGLTDDERFFHLVKYQKTLDELRKETVDSLSLEVDNKIQGLLYSICLKFEKFEHFSHLCAKQI